MSATGPAARRLFFALWPDAAARQAIQKASRAVVRKCGGRPVLAGNYHITLAFLGDQPTALCDDIMTAGRAVSARSSGLPVDLELDRFGYWPKPRVFWVGPSENFLALSLLADALWSELEGLGIARDQRALQPHVTLARKVQRVPEVDAPLPVRWAVRDFALIESVTASSGAEYNVVARFPQGFSPGLIP